MYHPLTRSTSVQSDLDPLYTDIVREKKKLKNFLALVFTLLACSALITALVVLSVKFGSGRNKNDHNPQPYHDTLLAAPETQTVCGTVKGTFSDDSYIFKVRKNCHGLFSQNIEICSAFLCTTSRPVEFPHNLNVD